MALGAVVIVVAVIVALLLTPTPTTMGLQPYRDGKPKRTSRLDPNSGYMRSEALRMPVFWIFMLGVLLLNIAALSVMQNVISSLIRDKGYTDAAATNVFTVLQICNAGGGLLAGVLLDKIGYGRVVTIYLTLQILAMLCMFRAEFVVLALAFAVMFGFCNNVCSSVTSGLTSEIFGLKDYGSIYGTIGLPLMIGMSVGPLIAGSLVDAMGHYTVIWIMGIVLVLLVMPCYLVPYYLRKKGKLKPPASDLEKMGDQG